MRKLFLVLIGAVLVSTSLFARVAIPLTLNGDDDNSSVGHSNPKSPDETPTVYIEDYTLYFETNHPEYVLNIKDEDGDVVYTAVVYSAQTQVVLPSTLSGDYVIELAMGNWLFTGWINL